MKRISLLALFFCLVLAACTASDEPEADRENGGPVEGAEEIIALTEEFISALAKGEFETATQHFDETMKKELPPEKLAQLWADLESQLGPFAEQRYDRTEEQGGYRLVLMDGSFEQADVVFQVTFDGQNRIAGFFIR